MFGRTRNGVIGNFEYPFFGFFSLLPWNLPRSNVAPYTNRLRSTRPISPPPPGKFAYVLWGARENRNAFLIPIFTCICKYTYALFVYKSVWIEMFFLDSAIENGIHFFSLIVWKDHGRQRALSIGRQSISYVDLHVRLLRSHSYINVIDSSKVIIKCFRSKVDFWFESVHVYTYMYDLPYLI